MAMVVRWCCCCWLRSSRGRHRVARERAARQLTHPELATPVVPARQHAAARRREQRVPRSARRERHPLPVEDDSFRRGFVGAVARPELPARVVAPRVRAALRVDGDAVAAAAREPTKREATELAQQLWRQPRLRVAAPELAVAVPAKAEDLRSLRLLAVAPSPLAHGWAPRLRLGGAKIRAGKAGAQAVRGPPPAPSRRSAGRTNVVQHQSSRRHASARLAANLVRDLHVRYHSQLRHLPVGERRQRHAMVHGREEGFGCSRARTTKASITTHS